MTTTAAVILVVVPALLGAVVVLTMRQLVGDVRVELRGLAERVATLEHGQREAGLGLASLGAGLAEAGATTRGVAEATSAIRDQLARARAALAALESEARARQALEQTTADAVRRLETILTGSHSKGLAGEHLLELMLGKLPAEWQVRNARVGSKVVEFGLRLPNHLILPVDSKWPATHLVEQLATCEQAEARARLKSELEAAVLAKAREVRKYIDPHLTTGFAIAAVPDAVFELCGAAIAEAGAQGVVLVSYSLLVPYVLLVFQTTLRLSRQLDRQRLDRYARAAYESLAAAEDELEGRLARALVMLGNARDALALHLGRARTCLAGLQLDAGDAAPASEMVDPVSLAGAEGQPRPGDTVSCWPPPTAPNGQR